MLLSTLYTCTVTLYEELGQASDAITDMSNPSYGASEGRNQGNRTAVEHYTILHTGIGSVPLLYEEIMTNKGQEVNYMYLLYTVMHMHANLLSSSHMPVHMYT